ncbi:ubiquitin-like small modifier protein 2 [Halosolutus amylolyticus]|uniref:Ubiquitin-like small modifier protein 2 n=1 Tax=Halosolutus amylolyticus TaxID=2932267 RepID=A0ABD5PK95_9EURY|nr:ubiquitin-like small modifier protein 2 [Halosolutus amylolyticus]
MHVTVDVKGEDTHEFDLNAVATDADRGPTYADLLREVDLSPHEVSVLVDGRPVPEDQPVDHDHVTVLRLIKGG